MHLYVVARSAAGPVKVGISANPKRRIRALECAGGVRLPRVWVSRALSRARDIEAHAHRLLHQHRTQGEWFDVPFEDAAKLARDLTSRKTLRRHVMVITSGSQLPVHVDEAQTAMDHAADAALPLLLDFLERERVAGR